MQVDIKNLPKSEVKLTAEVKPEKMEEFFNEAVSVLAKDLELKGFRKGHAPKEVAEKALNSKDILEKGAELAVQKTYPEIILENKIEAIGSPEIKITKISRGDSFLYEARIAVLPHPQISNYKNIKVQKQKIEVEEKEVDQAIWWLRKSRAKYITVSRPAKAGDKVEIDFNSLIAGVPIEDGQGKNHSFILGKGRFVPGFEENLEGMKKDEKRSFSTHFPEDYYKKNLAGKNVDFEVKMNLVQKVELPQLNDEFAKTLGDFPNLISLKKSIKDGIWQEKAQKEKQRLREEILEKISEKTKTEIPNILLEKELDKMMGELKQNIESAGLKFDDYLTHLKKSPEEIRKGWRDLAAKRIKTALILMEIAKKENVEVSDNEIKEEINQKVLSRYPNPKEAEKKINLDEVKEYMRGAIRNEKVLELLEQIATR